MRWLPGRHLYSQIVVPLVAASICVALLATLIAVYFLGELTTGWVDEVARGAVENLDSRVTARAENMAAAAALIAGDQYLGEALDAGDATLVRGLVAKDNVLFEFDNTAVLDSGEVAIAASGVGDIEVGQVPFDEETRRRTDLSSTRSSLVEVNGRLCIVAFSPVSSDSAHYTVVIVERLDDEFLSSVAGGTGEAFAIFDSGKRLIASTALPSDRLSVKSAGDLDRALEARPQSVLEAIDDVGHDSDAASLEIPAGSFRVSAREFGLGDDSVGDDPGYLVAVVSQEVSDEARSTTANLIAMWSVVAVLALAGLGGWVARRVSDPLVTLTEGARRITEGDFSVAMPVEGANEIADLAGAFNQMTDSLQERSESLTKKVLELATLYEMSRALGSTLVMEVLLDSVLDSALRIFGVDAGYATLRDRETGQLELRAWRGDGEVKLDSRALRNSMSEWVIREGRPLIFNPPREAAGAQVDEVTGALAALCVPLNSPEGMLGAITVGSHNPLFRFTSDDVRLLSTIANHVTIAVGNIELFSSLQDAYLATVRSLAAAVDAKDPFTRGHSDRVAAYAVAIARELELSYDQQVALEMAAYLHDIGKIGVREEILLKPGMLSSAEMAQMRHHPLIGANILKPVGFPWPITPVVRHHHERWDGEGYPAGLQGEEIPFLARLLTVADAYEAMVSDRPYRRGRTQQEAIAELEACAGSQFDPRIVGAFVSLLASGQFQVAEEIVLSPEAIQPDELEAIFVALSEGMFTSFRKLGGPRLSSNVEKELNEFFAENSLPFRITQGRMSMGHDGNDADAASVEDMRFALEHMDETMGRMSGATLVDHFYADAAAGLSDRMRARASSLRFLRH